MAGGQLATARYLSGIGRNLTFILLAGTSAKASKQTRWLRVSAPLPLGERRGGKGKEASTEGPRLRGDGWMPCPREGGSP